MRCLFFYLFICVLFPLSGQTAQEYHALAVAKLAADKPKDALVAIERAVALAPDSLWWRISYADILRENDLYEDTRDELYRIVSLDSNFAFAYQRLAQSYLSSNQLDSSLHYFDIAIQKAPSDLAAQDFYVNRATALSVLRHFDEALVDFEQAYRIDTTNVVVLNNLALLYDDLDRMEESIQMLKRIIDLDSTFIGAYANLGFIYSKQDSLLQSAYYFDRALALDPNDAIILNNKGHLHYRREEYGTALDLINRSINRYPTNSYAYRNRALVYFALDLQQEACRDLEIATYYEFSLRHGDEVEVMYAQRCTVSGE